MRTLLAAILITGCTCGAPAHDPTPAPPRAAEPPPAPAPARAPEPEPTPPSATDARAFLRRLREARALSRSDHHAEAYAIFAELARERPGQPRLRCEAGFVALRAERLDDAEREVEAALALWPAPPAPDDRVAYAMCLYNRGRVAEARDDRAEAARAYRASLALRPNASVEERLAALGVDDQEEEGLEEDGEVDVGILSGAIASLAAAAEATDAPDVDRVTSERTGRIAARVHIRRPDEDELEVECTEDDVVVADRDGSHAVTLDVSLSLCRIWSYFRDEGWIDAPSFHAGPAELGELVAVTVSRSGRGDSDDGTGIEESLSTTLHLCAERRAFACAEVELVSIASFDCLGSGGCDDPDDPGDDPDEGDGPLPAPYTNGYALGWAIDGDALVLTPAARDDITGPIAPPRTGRVPLVSLFPR